MATNYVLVSSSCNSSDSDEDTSRAQGKIDMSFQNLSTSNLEHNLTTFSGQQGTLIDRMLLYNNRLESLPASFTTTLINLQLLDLSNNLIDVLSYDINRLTSLTQLYLRNNMLTNQSFPKNLSGLTKLRDLNLSGNQLTAIPPQILELTFLRNLFVGGNQLETMTPGIKSLKRLRVFYLGGNRLRSLPAEICELSHLHALILANNELESLPDSICRLKRLECLQVHQNRLTTLPHGLIHLDSLSELSLRDNPLVVRFVREMTFQPSSMLELAARVVTINRIPYEESDLPRNLNRYLTSSHTCVNPNCQGVYFNTKVEHIKFVDFCGKYKIPLMQYLCSSRCKDNNPAVMRNNTDLQEETDKMRRVLLG